FAQDRADSIGSRFATKGALARKHLVKNRPERKNIGTMIGWFSAHLLRRHVADRAHHHAGISINSSRRHFSLRLCSIARACQFRQTKIKDLYSPVFRDEDVLWFQIAMHDAFLMR